MKSFSKDAVDRYDMRRSEFLRAGKHSESVFKKRENPQTSKPGPSRPTTSRGQHRRGLKRQIGDFEVSTSSLGFFVMALLVFFFTNAGNVEITLDCLLYSTFYPLPLTYLLFLLFGTQ